MPFESESPAPQPRKSQLAAPSRHLSQGVVTTPWAGFRAPRELGGRLERPRKPWEKHLICLRVQGLKQWGLCVMKGKYIYTDIHVDIYVYTYICNLQITCFVSVYVRMYVCMYVCMCVCMLLYIYIYVIHNCMRVHIYIQYTIIYSPIYISIYMYFI